MAFPCKRQPNGIGVTSQLATISRVQLAKATQAFFLFICLFPLTFILNFVMIVSGPRLQPQKLRRCGTNTSEYVNDR